jgi:hypothetical protein
MPTPSPLPPTQQEVELADIRAREGGVDPRRAHLKYLYTSYPRLSFPVVNLFALGSPIGVFLLVRALITHM